MLWLRVQPKAHSRQIPYSLQMARRNSPDCYPRSFGMPGLGIRPYLVLSALHAPWMVCQSTLMSTSTVGPARRLKSLLNLILVQSSLLVFLLAVYTATSRVQWKLKVLTVSSTMCSPVDTVDAAGNSTSPTEDCRDVAEPSSKRVAAAPVCPPSASTRPFPDRVPIGVPGDAGGAVEKICVLMPSSMTGVLTRNSEACGNYLTGCHMAQSKNGPSITCQRANFIARAFIVIWPNLAQPEFRGPGIWRE